MVIISKPLFYSKIGPEIRCEQAFHEGTNNCFKAVWDIMLKYFGPGVFYFYLSIYAVKLLIDYKKINIEYFKNFFKKYLRSVCYGVSFGYLTIISICLGRKLFGTFHYYMIGFGPGFIAGLSILFEDKLNRHLNTLLWSSLVVEALFNNSYYFQIIKYSPLRETIIFMLVNSCMMRLMMRESKQKLLHLWFYVPSREKDASNLFNLKECLLNNLKYFGFGYGLSSARPILSVLINLFKSSKKDILAAFFSMKSFKFGMLFYMYIVLFKSLMKFLQEYNNSVTVNANIAGFIAGLAYYIKPTRNLLGLAIVTVLQILCKEHLSFQKVTKFPVFVLIYMVCNGILFHNRLFAMATCPNYYRNMTKIASKGFLDALYTTLVDRYILGK